MGRIYEENMTLNVGACFLLAAIGNQGTNTDRSVNENLVLKLY